MRKSSLMVMVLAVALGSSTVVFARGGGGGGGMGGGSGMVGGGQGMSSQGAQAPSGDGDQEKIRTQTRTQTRTQEREMIVRAAEPRSDPSAKPGSDPASPVVVNRSGFCPAQSPPASAGGFCFAGFLAEPPELAFIASIASFSDWAAALGSLLLRVISPGVEVAADLAPSAVAFGADRSCWLSFFSASICACNSSFFFLSVSISVSAVSAWVSWRLLVVRRAAAVASAAVASVFRGGDENIFQVAKPTPDSNKTSNPMAPPIIRRFFVRMGWMAGDSPVWVSELLSSLEA